MTKENPLNVRVGDVVSICLYHNSSEPLERGPFQAKVTGIVERYGEDLIKYNRLDGYIPKIRVIYPDMDIFFSIHYVNKIIQRAPYEVKYKAKENCLKLLLRPWHYYKGNRNLLVGCIDRLVKAILSNQDIEIKYGLKEDLYLLWLEANRPGFTGIKDTWYGMVVNRKHFTRWVLRAYKKMLRSRSQWLVDEREHEKRQEREYWEDCEAERRPRQKIQEDLDDYVGED